MLGLKSMKPHYNCFFEFCPAYYPLPLSHCFLKGQIFCKQGGEGMQQLQAGGDSTVLLHVALPAKVAAGGGREVHFKLITMWAGLQNDGQEIAVSVVIF